MPLLFKGYSAAFNLIISKFQNLTIILLFIYILKFSYYHLNFFEFSYFISYFLLIWILFWRLEVNFQRLYQIIIDLQEIIWTCNCFHFSGSIISLFLIYFEKLFYISWLLFLFFLVFLVIENVKYKSMNLVYSFLKKKLKN